MAIAATAPQTQTAQAYLDQEVESDTRNEYRNGEIIPMTGGTPTHNKLASALNALLWMTLRKQPYTVFVTDQRLWIPDRDIYTYPDVMVVAEPTALKPGRKDTVMSPLLIAEVLSNSTEQYDRAAKFAAYRTIPTFQEYLLIAQDKYQVEQYVKQAANQWLFIDHQGLEQTIELRSLNTTIALADLYEDIDITAS